MNILVTIDQKYINFFKQMILSIYLCNEKLNVYLMNKKFDESIKEDLISFFEKQQIGNLEFVDFINLNTNDEIKFQKLFAPFLISKDIDRILYLDCDIVCTYNINEFYYQNFDNNVLIGCNDFSLQDFEGNYLNTGVLLIDLNKYRESINYDELLNIVNNYESDSQFLNEVFADKIKYEDITYNYQINFISPEYDYASLIHYSGLQKPWLKSYSYPIKAIKYYEFLNKIGMTKQSKELSECHFRNATKLLESVENNQLNKKLDIIMPSYNATSTIRDTLDSIVNQVVDGIDVTVYLIDDCSDEDYRPIVDEYSSKLNLKYFRMDKNSGVALARQRGMDEGDGEFFTIIDSDDQFYSPYSIKAMYLAIVNNNADIVRSVFMGENSEEPGDFTLYRQNNIGCHGKLYRKQFILDNNIRYLDLRGNEDTAYHALLKACGAKYFDLDFLTYRWCFNPNSFTRRDPNYHETDLITFSQGFVWTAEQIANRASYIYDAADSIADLLGWIYLRIEECWYEETKNIMYSCVHKILDAYKRVSDEDVVAKISIMYNIEDIAGLNEYINKAMEY